MARVVQDAGKVHARLADFIATAVATVRPGDDDSFFAMRAAFDALIADRSVWSSVLNAELSAILTDPNNEGGGRWLMQRLLIHACPRFTLSLATNVFELAAPQQRLEENKDFLLAPGGHVMLAFLHDQPVQVHRYALPADSDYDVFDPATALESLGTTTIPSKQRIDIDGRREAIDFDMPEDGVAVVMNAAPCVSQLWSIEARTLKPLGASIANERVSIMMTMLNELARVRHQPALEVVSQLTRHPDHNIRWCAMKCLGRLDGDAAIKHLEQLVADPHPYVRAAARTTLDKLESSKEVAHVHDAH